MSEAAGQDFEAEGQGNSIGHHPTLKRLQPCAPSWRAPSLRVSKLGDQDNLSWLQPLQRIVVAAKALREYTFSTWVGRPGQEVISMSPHETARSSRNSTVFLLILLCLSLLGWRVSTRLEQYRPSVAGRSAAVNFFDANERNIASIDEARSTSRDVAGEQDWLFLAVRFVPPVQPTRRFQRDTRTLLPPIYVDSVSLFSNPPPASTA
jgi:hypothetical protein